MADCGKKNMETPKPIFGWAYLNTKTGKLETGQAKHDIWKLLRNSNQKVVRVEMTLVGKRECPSKAPSVPHNRRSVPEEQRGGGIGANVDPGAS